MPRRAPSLPPSGAVVFDLDGTILSVNSFRLWVMHLIGGRFPHLSIWRRAALSVAALRALAVRKAGMISHETLKWRLQRQWQKAVWGDGGASERDFVSHLSNFIRPELMGVLAAVADGRIEAVMATAAAADYAEAFGNYLGFRHILATARAREEGSPSLVGVRKRDAVLNYLARKGWGDKPIVFFTDHVDDLPLILKSATVYWFGNEEERRAIAGRLPEISVLPGARGEEIVTRVDMGAGS